MIPYRPPTYVHYNGHRVSLKLHKSRFLNRYAYSCHRVLIASRGLPAGQCFQRGWQSQWTSTEFKGLLLVGGGGGVSLSFGDLGAECPAMEGCRVLQIVGPEIQAAAV